MPTCVFELASLPHAVFNLSYFFLVLEEEARGLAVVRTLGGEGQIPNTFECGFEPVEVVSSEFETPEVVLGVPWALSLIMIRDRIQWSSILRIISRNDANDMRVWSHDHSCIACWDAPPPVVGDYAGYVVDPAIEIES